MGVRGAGSIRHRWKVVAQARPADARAAPLLGKRGDAERHAFGDRLGASARRSRIGELVAGAEDKNARRSLELELGKIGGRGGNNAARVEQPPRGKQFLALSKVRTAHADVPGGSGMLVDDRGIAAAADILLNHDAVGAVRNGGSGEDPDGSARGHGPFPAAAGKRASNQL